MRCPRVGSVRILRPVAIWDQCDPRIQWYSGHKVRVVQPVGCPRNGTMAHCYVEDVRTQAFIGLVLVSSLQAAGAAERGKHGDLPDAGD